MPIDPSIALGVRPVEMPNVLGQFGQMVAIKAAQQEMEGDEGSRNALAKGMAPTDPRILQYGKSGRETFKAAGEGRIKQLEAASKSNLLLGSIFGGVLQDPTTGPQAVARLKDMGLLTEAQAQKVIVEAGNNPDVWRRIAKPYYDGAISAEKRLAEETSIENNKRTVGASYYSSNITKQNNEYNQQNPTQHFFTNEDGTLNRVSTRGSGAAAPVPMAGPSAPLPQVTVGGGGAAPMGAGSSIMVNPSSVNAFNPNSQNGLITQPQTQVPLGSNFAKVRQPPTAITNINAFAPASETAQTEFMKGSRATFDQLKHAPTVLENIEKAKALVSTAKGFMGTGGETMLEAAKFMNNRFGTSIDTAGIKSAEELNSRLFMGIMDNLKKMDAQPSQQQQAAMKQALGNLGTDPNAMNAVLDVFGDIVRGKVDIYNAEVTGAEERGIKFPYNPVIKLKERTPSSTGDIATDAGVAKVIKSNAEFNALPSGTIFTAPDGTTRRKP